ncbi:hypothetical protein R4L22_01540 [Brachyspira pilosicoli]|uniref:hypothetical protein n=1 Tax=Brachyspira pilosicoli TaxID=52584 RepID=UPI001E44A6A6|nr:hypothetical protein [Brachyspira pilosicoli]
MLELNINNKDGIYEVYFRSNNKDETFKIYSSLAVYLKKNTEGNQEVIENKTIDYSKNPLEGASKNVYWNLFRSDRLIEYYNNEKLEQGYKDYIKNELNKREIFDLSLPVKETKKSKKEIKEKTSNNKQDDYREHEFHKKIEEIKNGRDIMVLTDEELEKIALLESQLAAIYKYPETAKNILQGRKFNKSRKLEDEITKGRRLEQLTVEELKELKEVTMLDRYKEDIQKEIDKRKKESFEEQLQKDNSIISFSEDEEEAHYKIDEDPLSSDSDINRWDFDADSDGIKIDHEGNRMLFS